MTRNWTNQRGERFRWHRLGGTQKVNDGDPQNYVDEDEDEPELEDDDCCYPPSDPENYES